MSCQGCPRGTAWPPTTAVRRRGRSPPDGRWFRGAGAINAALATVVGNRLPLWIYQLPVIRWAQDAAYDWIARNRRLFPGVTPWCSTHPDAGCDADTSSTAALI
ncbi:MAG: DCC1-like thiol-disulfide oxidoreductase family protein [Geodermatophilaceae bacterium]